MSNIFVTGGSGFLGWHLRARLHAVHGATSTSIGRGELDALAGMLQGAPERPVLHHVAGVNRAGSDAEVEQGNLALGRAVADAVRKADRPLDVVFANSIQADTDNPYGRGKAGAAELVAEAVDEVGGLFADVVLPNLFGEHGRPDYNSFVATFAHRVANGSVPQVQVDRELPLLHAQSAAAALIDAASRSGRTVPAGEIRRVTEVLASLQTFDEVYKQGQIPALDTPFDVALFNTYRSHLFPHHYPFALQAHTDPRGTLFETVRVHGSTGQTFVSITNPSFTRGEHYHLRKIERFCVIEGRATIALRRLLTDETVVFEVAGDQPTFVDMPTLWVHNITNVGDGPLVTQFWTDQLLDPEAPDTYWEPVGDPRKVTT